MPHAPQTTADAGTGAATLPEAVPPEHRAGASAPQPAAVGGGEGLEGVEAEAEAEAELPPQNVATGGVPINPPGQWYAMVSYTQRNAEAKLLAAEVYSAMRERGKAVWLDVKMEQLNAAAMKEAAERSRCVIAIVTGVERDGDPEDTAYFKREYCMSELRWAREAGVPIQPVIARDDKARIGEFIAQAPSDLQDLGSVDFKALDRISPAMWTTSIDELISSIDRLRARRG